MYRIALLLLLPLLILSVPLGDECEAAPAKTIAMAVFEPGIDIVMKANCARGCPEGELRTQGPETVWPRKFLYKVLPVW